jgi:predicted unusual protein kinase regulating ubiquinone biosynthesis (AarF/ABC1/UbiB family)
MRDDPFSAPPGSAPPPLPAPRPLPTGRLARAARLGGIAAGLTLGTAAEGLRQLARGERPRLAAAALTPANAQRLTGGLAGLRGAAMKLGQMLSLDSGLALPPELSAILARLRAEAPPMPPAQLKRALAAEWGPDWHRRFVRFEVRPIAAASIGQVHRALTRDGRDLAIKLQFPGVRASIDSDLANLAALIRGSGVLPRGLDLTPLLDQARAQLHDEADYRREGAALAAFGAALADDPDFAVPRLHADLSTPQLLAMDYIAARPIDALAEAPQATRDRAAAALIRLTLRELFDFGRMQTDPNFGNYRLAPDGRIVLLDFGATRAIAPATAAAYRRLLGALLDRDLARVRAEMLGLGYFAAAHAPDRQALIVDLADHAAGALRQTEPYDFAATDLIADLARRGRALGEARDFWHVPPADLLFLHRKIAGMYLLARRLRARVALRPLLEPFR